MNKVMPSYFPIYEEDVLQQGFQFEFLSEINSHVSSSYYIHSFQYIFPFCKGITPSSALKH